jgi:hypothetical protein
MAGVVAMSVGVGDRAGAAGSGIGVDGVLFEPTLSRHRADTGIYPQWPETVNRSCRSR